jgi:heptaprenyl diphosphate synthase
MTYPMQRLSRLALLLALATVIHTAEALLPITFVWFRFGFANIIGLSTLYLFGFNDALVVTLGRILLGSLAAGLFGSPAFILSFAGGMCSILAMGLVHRYCTAVFSEIGISVIGAVVHNLAQITVAYLLLVKNQGIFLLVPLMLFAAMGTGIVNGLATRFLVRHFNKVQTSTNTP